MIKRIICIVILLWTTSVSSASAHFSGQPPFFLMNGKYADFYPIAVTSLKDFVLPQDIAPETYLINTPISFEIDKKMLPFPDEVIDKTTFSWDFGDGTKGVGLMNTHTYTKIGSFLLTITADYQGYSDTNTKPVIQAVLLHVLPNSSYKLAIPVIKINNKEIKDPQNNPVTIIPKRTVTFDASTSQKGTSATASYFWDRGDGTSNKEPTFSYQYDSNQAYFFPFVRLTDANGFITDTYIQIEQETISDKQFPYIIPLLIGINILIGTVLFFTIFRKR